MSAGKDSEPTKNRTTMEVKPKFETVVTRTFDALANPVL